MASSVRFHPCFLVASILLYYVIGLLATAHNVQAQLTPYKGQHLMKVSIGTPPIDIYGLADTGSSLVWTRCPCDVCYNQIHPKFDPKKSMHKISCQSEQCHLLLDEATCSPQNICNFNTRYASGLSEGVLAKEKVTITSTSRQAVSFDIAFGCAHNDSFYFDAMGIIGLGPGLRPLFHKLVARGFLTACYHMVLILVLQAR